MTDWFKGDLQKPLCAVMKRGQDWTLGFDDSLCPLLDLDLGQGNFIFFMVWFHQSLLRLHFIRDSYSSLFLILEVSLRDHLS